MSAPPTTRAAMSALWTFVASRSPPKHCPAVTTVHSRSDNWSSWRENHAGSEPPSVITYATRASGVVEWIPASTGASAECRSATTTGIPPRSSQASTAARCGESSSSTARRIACIGV
jgi:hypothetical protein